MKIKTASMRYEDVLALPAPVHQKPVKQHFFFRIVLLLLSVWDLLMTRFTYRTIGLEKLDREEPCLVLMNHSSFIDLKIAAKLLFHRPFHIVCTSDGFVGKRRLMRYIGCIPAQKFTTDVTLVRDMVYVVKELKSSVLMFPEASYSFDGTQTPLPESLGKCLKLLRVPVVMIRTSGAFARDPLYNNLQLRKVHVSAEVEYLLSPEDIAQKSPQELNALLQEKFTFDYFRWQQDNKVRIDEPFRADGLNRMLYKCPRCKTEGQMLGQGTRIRCGRCRKAYELTEYGYLQPVEDKEIGTQSAGTEIQTGEALDFTHIPDWYRWERECVKQELLAGTYRLEAPVVIFVMVNMDCIYRVGEGTLIHSREGFHLTGCGGRLDYVQEPSASYSLYSDFYWYEIGDVICIGDSRIQYYCFPQNCGDIVAKARLAAEELYKLVKGN
ncbi:MAG: 1-acyl-sn-glycerol-3-phosphate acyltransferase [Blautia sp.]|nr:1-acyl-sn-glycerol-3-phosphate acyltransferase [Blautia sp.]MCM1199899.1 1-acyl-sn-glycerol-3-phosphate acyltransferase [Bacteroides fragilis]